jgi:transcriptional regulator, gntR family
MMLEVTYLPVSQFFSLTAHDVEQKSLYQIFEEDYNIKIGVAEEEFKASIARSDDATLLQISEGSPVLSLTRTTYNDRNIIVEFTLSVARADQFRYKIVHTRS